MKYGIIFNKVASNLSDDILTYAQTRYLPQIDYIIEKEQLDTFRPDKKESINVIMNGWSDFNSNLILSPFINPIYISNESVNENELLNLDDFILTIDSPKNLKINNELCLVDVDRRIEYKLRDLGIEYIESTFKVNKYIYKNIGFEKRMDNVKELLKLYKKCKLIITSELKVALLCLSIGANVLLVNNMNKDKIKTPNYLYMRFLNHVTIDEFINSFNLKYENVKKPLSKKKYIDKLVSKVMKSIKKQDISSEDLLFFEKYYVDRKKIIDEYYINKLEELDKKIEEQKENIYKLELRNKFLKKNFTIMQKRSCEAFEFNYKMKQSRFYKIYSKMQSVVKKVRREK